MRNFMDEVEWSMDPEGRHNRPHDEKDLIELLHLEFASPLKEIAEMAELNISERQVRRRDHS